ncbi:MAG TPA: hypothetical protein VH763_03160 [Gemmatimonadales bacterium]
MNAEKKKAIAARIVSSLVLLAFLSPRPAAAQAATDTTTRPDTSAASTRAYGDSISQQAQDTGRTKAADSVAAPDSTAAQPNTPAKPTPQAQPAPPPQPVDSALKTACRGAPAGAHPPGLLLVTFSDTLSQKQRVAAVRKVGGALLGPAAAGGDYVQVPPDPASARAAADSLIRTFGVLQISERSCPAPAPPAP